jgi:hypothetical protein
MVKVLLGYYVVVVLGDLSHLENKNGVSFMKLGTDRDSLRKN